MTTPKTTPLEPTGPSPIERDFPGIKVNTKCCKDCAFRRVRKDDFSANVFSTSKGRFVSRVEQKIYKDCGTTPEDFVALNYDKPFKCHECGPAGDSPRVCGGFVAIYNKLYR